MNGYRPHGILARAIYEKFHNDNLLDEYDTSQWYSLNFKLPAYFQSKFVPLSKPDEATKQWLERAKRLSSNIWLHVWHSIARTILQFFMTQTDINGFLNRGSMFILSEQQFEMLLRVGGFDIGSCDKITMLDIGAGDGKISLRLLNSLEGSIGKSLKVRAFATETSWTMRKRLKKHNFNVIDKINEIQDVHLISCLNVLDRCIDPFELLHDMHKALAPNGRVVVALVLPYVHYVEFNSSHLPLRLLMDNHSPSHDKQLPFETEANIFFELLENSGFRVEAWTKAPYLCEGDLRQSFYWLIDLIVVLSKKPMEE